tara:strand:+ start:6803 stop:8077 length:1275 start_codon:yes stop_codon:yes gene_type:complete
MKSNVIDIKKTNYFPSQWDFLVNKQKAKIKAYVGGFGSGKTHSFLHCTFINLLTKKNNEGKSNGLILYPTYSLAEEVFVEPFREILERNGIDYTYNIANHRFKTAYGNIKIYQTRHPQRIVGSSYTYVGIDELDIESYKYAEMAVQKALGRLRGCEDAELFITTTPEGFGYTYHLMVEQSSDSKLLVHGKTTDNPYLPKSYIESLKENYDGQLLKAYIDGQFVNLNQGATYYGFKRDDAVKECKYNRSLPIRIGMDWNVDPLCAVIFQIYPNKQVKVIKELALSHQGAGDLMTQRMCDAIKDLYPSNTYIAYPDATGASRHSSAQYSDLDIVRANGFKLMVKHINPRVVNRVNSMNNQLSKNNILIDPSCKLLIKDLEQVCNKEGSRDIDKSNKDLSHMSDALGYGIEWEYKTLRPNRIGVADR